VAWCSVLCCAVLCYAVVYCAVVYCVRRVCCVVLAVLCSALPCHAVVWCGVVRCGVVWRKCEMICPTFSSNLSFFFEVHSPSPPHHLSSVLCCAVLFFMHHLFYMGRRRVCGRGARTRCAKEQTRTTRMVIGERTTQNTTRMIILPPIF